MTNWSDDWIKGQDRQIIIKRSSTGYQTIGMQTCIGDRNYRHAVEIKGSADESDEDLIAKALPLLEDYRRDRIEDAKE